MNYWKIDICTRLEAAISSWFRDRSKQTSRSRSFVVIMNILNSLSSQFEFPRTRKAISSLGQFVFCSTRSSTLKAITTFPKKSSILSIPWYNESSWYPKRDTGALRRRLVFLSTETCLTSHSGSPSSHSIQHSPTILPLSYDILQNTPVSGPPGLPDVPCILLHGLLGSRTNLRSLAKHLPFTKFILPDLRNHGRSPHSLSMGVKLMAKDIIRLLDELRIENVGIIGHSMGELKKYMRPNHLRGACQEYAHSRMSCGVKPPGTNFT